MNKNSKNRLLDNPEQVGRLNEKEVQHLLETQQYYRVPYSRLYRELNLGRIPDDQAVYVTCIAKAQQKFYRQKHRGVTLADNVYEYARDNWKSLIDENIIKAPPKKKTLDIDSMTLGSQEIRDILSSPRTDSETAKKLKSLLESRNVKIGAKEIDIKNIDDLHRVSYKTIQSKLKTNQVPTELIETAKTIAHQKYREYQRGYERKNQVRINSNRRRKDNRLLDDPNLILKSYSQLEVQYLVDTRQFYKLGYRYLRRLLQDDRIPQEDREEVLKTAIAQERWVRLKNKGKQPEQGMHEYSRLYWNTVTLMSSKTAVDEAIRNRDIVNIKTNTLKDRLRAKSTSADDRQFIERELRRRKIEASRINPSIVRRKSTKAKKARDEEYNRPFAPPKERPLIMNREESEQPLNQPTTEKLNLPTGDDRQAMIEAFLNKNPHKREQERNFSNITQFRWDDEF